MRILTKLLTAVQTIAGVLVCCSTLLYAQSSGQGGTGSSSSASSMESSMNTDSSAFDETVTTAEFQGLQDSTDRGFIGAAAPDKFVGVDEVFESFVTSSSSARTSSARSAARSAMRTSTSRMNTRSTSSSSSQGIRSASVIDFAYPAISSQHRQIAVQEQLRTSGFRDSSVVVQHAPAGNVAVVSGNFSSEKERKLAVQLLLLEPGIDAVSIRPAP